MQYFVISEGKQHGPFTEEELRQMCQAGRIGDENLVWHEGLSDWRPASEFLGPATEPTLPPLPSLPPIPKIHAPIPASVSITSERKPSAMRSASGIIALLLFILAIFNVGGCINAESKLQAFTSGSDPDEAPRMFLETAQGITQNDPWRGISNMFDRKAALTSDAEGAQLGAWLCMIGAAVAGVVFYRTNSSTKIVSLSSSQLGKLFKSTIAPSSESRKSNPGAPASLSAPSTPQLSPRAKNALIGIVLIPIGIGIFCASSDSGFAKWIGVCMIGVGGKLLFKGKVE